MRAQTTINFILLQRPIANTDMDINWCFAIFVVAVVILATKFYKFWTSIYTIPNIDVDEYWGPGSKTTNTVVDQSVREFKIEYPQKQIDELAHKLSENYVLTEALEDATNNEYGMNSKKLEEHIHYWRDNYLPRWNERLALLNSWPHFKTNIQGLVLPLACVCMPAERCHGSIFRINIVSFFQLRNSLYSCATNKPRQQNSCSRATVKWMA